MEKQTKNQVRIKRMLRRYHYLSKTEAYKAVGNDLGISARLVQYIKDDPKRKCPRPVEILLEIKA